MRLTREGIKDQIFHKIKDLDSLQLSKFYIKMSVAPNARMEDISLIKEELRKANILKIKYYKIDDIICGGF